MAPSAEQFQELAGGSARRWTTLHFRHRSAFPGDCEAWVRRPDEVVVRTPDGSEHRGADDLMWGNYTWVAMLDPVELSHHVEVFDVRADEVAGRPAWWASVRALEGYDPRCSCCALIWSAISDSYEYDEPPNRNYPDHYDIALDVQTGVVVRWRPVGGDPAAAWLENDILDVEV